MTRSTHTERTRPRHRPTPRRMAALSASIMLAATPLAAAAASPGLPSDFADDAVTKPLEDRKANAADEAPSVRVAGVIVTHETGVATVALRSAASLATATLSAPVTLGVVSSPEVRALDFDAPVDLTTAERVIAELEELPGVLRVEPNTLLYAAAASPVIPNDEYFTYQHGLWDSRDSWTRLGITYPLPPGGFSVKAPALWQATTGRSDVVVAVLDTGRTAHPDLDGNTVAGYDFVSDAARARDGNGRDPVPDDEGDWNAAGQCGPGSDANDSSWHGTHVAGIVAAKSQDGYGIAGVAPTARVQHVRVLAQCGGTTLDIADAITWASGGSVAGVPTNATPAKILNLSLGGSGTCQPYLQSAIDGARSRGSVVIVAAGNEGDNAHRYNPANCRNVVTVAATDPHGMWTGYTNWGPAVDVSAPGGDFDYGDDLYGILSTLDAGTTAPAGPDWAFYQGTSMATPAVAGVAALVASIDTTLSAPQIEAAIRAAVQPFPQYGLLWDCDADCGGGIVDASLVPAPLQAARVTGTAKVGSTLQLASTWRGSPALSYQWLRNGAPISGATGASYKIKKADAGTSIRGRVLANKAGFPTFQSTSAALAVPAHKVAAKVKIKLKKKSVKRSVRARLIVRVKAGSLAKPTGKIKVSVGKKKSVTVKLKAKHRGKIVVRLPKLTKGTYRVKARYVPTKAAKKVAKAKTSKQVRLRVK